MDELKALITECERANQRAIDELGMGLIDLNAIERARAALAAYPVPAGHAQQAEAPIDTLDLYKKLCDLWREAVAVDTVIGRPAVLRQRIGALRDRVGRMKSIHLPAAPVSAPQGDPSFRALFIVRRPGHAPRIGFPVGDTAQSLVDWIKVNGPNIDVVEWNTACQPSPGTAWVTSAEEYLWAAEIEVPKAQPAPAPSVEAPSQMPATQCDVAAAFTQGFQAGLSQHPSVVQAPTAEAQAGTTKLRRLAEVYAQWCDDQAVEEMGRNNDPSVQHYQCMADTIRRLAAALKESGQ